MFDLEYSFVVGSYTIPSPWVGWPRSHGDGISFATLNPVTGAMRVRSTLYELNPSFLIGDRTAGLLWALTEPEVGGDLLTYSFTNQFGVELIGRLATGANAPCHLEIDRLRRLAFVSHFHGGEVTVISLDETGVGRSIVTRLTSPTEVSGRDLGAVVSRPHSARRVGNAELLIADTGRDLLSLYRLVDDGGIELSDVHLFEEGTGPRHLAFSESSSACYVANQESGSLGVIRIVSTPDGRRLLQVRDHEVHGLNRARPRPSEVILHPNGRVIYVANRVDNSISVFRVLADGLDVELVGSVDSEGYNPRHFSLTQDGRFMIVANGLSDEIVSFFVHDDGRVLEPTGERLNLNTPSFVLT